MQKAYNSKSKTDRTLEIRTCSCCRKATREAAKSNFCRNITDISAITNAVKYLAKRQAIAVKQRTVLFLRIKRACM